MTAILAGECEVGSSGVFMEKYCGREGVSRADLWRDALAVEQTEAAGA